MSGSPENGGGPPENGGGPPENGGGPPENGGGPPENGGGPPENGGGPPENGGGPPENVPGRGPPKRVREKFSKSSRNADGTIEVSDNPLEELSQNVDWDNLTPFQEYVLVILDENGLLDE